MKAIARNFDRSRRSSLDDRRVAAGLVDLALVAAGGALILLAAGALGGEGSLSLSLVALIAAWAVYYHFALESGSGQTVGKKLMRLRVASADGGAAGMREVALRSVLRIVDGIGFYLVGLVAMLATGDRRQRLGDLVAGTVVVDAEPGDAPAEPVVPAVTADAPAAEPALPRMTSTAIQELAEDVARTADPDERSEDDPGDAEYDLPPAAEDRTAAAEDLPAAVEEAPGVAAEDPEIVRVKPVERVSAMDLVMDGDDDEPSAPGSAHERASSAQQ